MIRSTIPRPSAIAPTTGPVWGFVAGAGGWDDPGAGNPGMGGPGVGGPGVGGPGVGGPGVDGTGPCGAYPRGMGAGGTDPWYPGPGDAWAETGGGKDHQLVSPGGTIVCRSCGIGPVPAMPSGADSGGGAGSAAPGCAPDGAAAAAGGGAAAAGGGAWGQGRDDAAATDPVPDVGFFSHQRCSAGICGRTRGAARGSRVISRLLPDAQSGSQHACSRRASASTCGSPSAASCFQASVLNGGKKSFLANSRFLEL